MAGPYTKTRDRGIDDGWGIEDGHGTTIAITETERLIDIIMDALVNGAKDPPTFEEGVPYGEPE